LNIAPLTGGFTNSAYKIEGFSSYFAKFSRGQESLLGSSLQAEYDILYSISPLHLAPMPLYYGQEEGVLVTEFIIKNQTTPNLRDKDHLVKMCQQLKKLHSFDIPLPSHVCPYEVVKYLTANAVQVQATVPHEYIGRLLKEGENWKKSALHMAPKVPCHLDLHTRNMLFDEQEHLWFIDWEYAGLADPYYDLGVIGSGEFLSDVEMEQLLETYQGNEPVSEELKDHLWKMRILADARWALWCYIQQKLSPVDHPFQKWGDYYLHQSRKRFEAIAQDIQ
jgi:thiamine kinase-like enzyme